MLINRAKSINGINIRLTQERWMHITTSHPEIELSDLSNILSVIENPDMVLKGDFTELLAVKKQSRKDLWFVLVYKEIIDKKDGFVITAYKTSDLRWLFKRELIWSKKL